MQVLRSAALAQPQQLQDAALNARDEGIRFELQLIHQEVTDAITAFAANPTAATLRKLNGHWAHGSHMLAIAARKNRSGARGRTSV